MRRRLNYVFLGSVAALVMFSSLAYAFRSALATTVTRSVIAHSGTFSCTPIHVAIAPDFEHIAVQPVECTLRRGPTRHLRSEGDSVLELHDLRPLNVHIAKLSVDQHARDASNTHTAAYGELAGLLQSLSNAMLDFSELYTTGSPPLTIDELEWQRDGKPEASLRGFRRSNDGQWHRYWVESLAMRGADRAITAQAIDMRVTRTRGELSASVYFSPPKPGQVPDLTLRLLGRNLDQRQPRFDVKL
jgi:hypothetical protein